MRFAIATADKHEGVFHALRACGWAPVKLFTFFLQEQCMGTAVAEAASKLGVPVQTSRLTDADLAQLKEIDCDVLVVANYPWRIGDWRPHLKHAVNFHPSPLPLGRGPWPLVRALRDGLDSWGVSCHRLSPDFDAGELLAQERFPLAPDETQEGLDLRCQLSLRTLAAKVAKDFPALWRRAAPQGHGDYWPRWSEADRGLDLSGTVDEAQRQLRAFGLLECTAQFGPLRMAVRRAVAWREPHPHAPGTLVHGQGKHLVFALHDGYLGLLEWNQVPATPFSQS